MNDALYDLMVIGAGPGGYIAAERAGAHGLRVLLVEKDALGGTCLNLGCIPTKTLLHSAKLYAQALDSARYGIVVENARFDYAAARARKERVVSQLRDGVTYQMTRRGVEVVAGEARFVGRGHVNVGGRALRANSFIIATGATPIKPNIPGIDAPHVVTTTEVLQVEVLPTNLVILGSDPLALGLATIFGLMGVPVAVVSETETLLPTMDSELVTALRLEMRYAALHLDCKIERIEADRVVAIEDGETREFPADLVVVSAGRAPNVDGLGLEALGVDFDAGGIRVDAKMRTNVPGVYAVGDVTGRSMWAHAAARMAEVAVRAIIGKPDTMRYHAIPTPVYTYPEIASVGLTEAAALAQNLPIRVARLPMNANGRFLAENDGRRGLCKVVVDARTDVVLGAHLIGPNATELIFGIAAMIEDEFRVQDVQQVVFAHPTVSEIFKDTLNEL